MATNYPINPRVRAYGKARIDIAQRAQTPVDWERLWVNPLHAFPFVWGEAWKQCMEYKVDDFAAEAGFFIDVLGLPANAFGSAYAMFTSPHGEFFFSFIPTPTGESSTPPDAIRLQFMVADIFATARELEQRGISFERLPVPLQPGSPLHAASFRTPNGIPVDLWGMVTSDLDPMLTIEPASTARLSADNGGEPRLEGDDHGEEEEEFDDDEGEEEDDETEIEEEETNGDGDIGLLEEDNEEDDEESLEGEEGDEGDEDLSEDEEEEDFDLDEDDDFIEDEDEDDEDDDDLDHDEDRLASSTYDQKGNLVSSQPAVNVGTVNSSGKLRIEIKEQAPEYIDLDIT
jgi:hypothetical protein